MVPLSQAAPLPVRKPISLSIFVPNGGPRLIDVLHVENQFLS
jgi:hypothetical protein